MYYRYVLNSDISSFINCKGIELGIVDYNNNHPHQSLGNKNPREYKSRFEEEFFPNSEDMNKNLSNLVLSEIG